MKQKAQTKSTVLFNVWAYYTQTGMYIYIYTHSLNDIVVSYNTKQIASIYIYITTYVDLYTPTSIPWKTYIRQTFPQNSWTKVPHS